MTAAMLILTACAGGSDSNSNSSTPASIVGAWEHTYANNCVETETFFDNNTVEIVSDQQVRTGDYTLTPPKSGTIRYELIISFTADNQLPDCLGNSNNLAGTTKGIWVEFATANIMDYYANSSGGSVYASLYRK